MQTVTEKLPNGNTIDYQIVDGTAFHAKTPQRVMSIISEALHTERRTRLSFAWGDTETGRDWGETYDIAGYIGRSTGRIKIPLLIPKINSHGGGAILDDCIVKIERKFYGDRKYSVIYKHPKYYTN